MAHYDGETREGSFLRRDNRFTAHVLLNGHEETVHVKNTGRLGELMLPGARAGLVHCPSEHRKTEWDLVSVWKDGSGWVNIDSQICNTVTREWLEGRPEPFGNLSLIRPETPYGQSRVDFYLEKGKRRILLEVKGCTLASGGKGLFPDAPTQRGVKHLGELEKARGEGYDVYLAYVIAIPGVRRVFPNRETHPEYGEALERARRNDLRVLYLPCKTGMDWIEIDKEAVSIEK